MARQLRQKKAIQAKRGSVYQAFPRSSLNLRFHLSFQRGRSQAGRPVLSSQKPRNVRFQDESDEMHVLVLDTKNHLIERVKLYKGTIYSSVTRSSEIFRTAIIRNCPHIIVCHNHPSGDPTPSSEDIDFTRQLIKGAEFLEIELLDHLIIGNPRYVSLKERLHW